MVANSPIDYEYLGTDTKDKVYDRVFVNGEEFEFMSNRTKLLKTFCNKFPE